MIIPCVNGEQNFDYYYYPGSLTTYPFVIPTKVYSTGKPGPTSCPEPVSKDASAPRHKQVHWFVLQHPALADPLDIDHFKEALGDNARDLQDHTMDLAVLAYPGPYGGSPGSKGPRVASGKAGKSPKKKSG